MWHISKPTKYRFQRGATLVEYMLLLSCIVFVAIPAITALGIKANDRLIYVGGTLTSMNEDDSGRPGDGGGNGSNPHSGNSLRRPAHAQTRAF